MINFKLSPKSEILMNNMASGVFVRNEILRKVDLMGFLVMAKEAIKQELINELGEKAKHFSVTFVGSNQYGMRLSVQADTVGMYLTKGTREHDIDATGNVLHFVWNGEEVFFESVSHPGIKPMEPQIKAAVNRGLTKAMMIYG